MHVSCFSMEKNVGKFMPLPFIESIHAIGEEKD
jgi:hypothetical protein